MKAINQLMSLVISLVFQTLFFLIWVSGARKGELLVLRWRHISFTDQSLNITDAWKGRDEIGDTKSGRSRIVPLSSRLLRSSTICTLNHCTFSQMIFCSATMTSHGLARHGDAVVLKEFSGVLKSRRMTGG